MTRPPARSRSPASTRTLCPCSAAASPGLGGWSWPAAKGSSPTWLGSLSGTASPSCRLKSCFACRSHPRRHLFSGRKPGGAPPAASSTKRRRQSARGRSCLALSWPQTTGSSCRWGCRRTCRCRCFSSGGRTNRAAGRAGSGTPSQWRLSSLSGWSLRSVFWRPGAVCFGLPGILEKMFSTSSFALQVQEYHLH